MDKLSVISGALFFAADLFAIAGLAMPNWIVSDVGGKQVKKLTILTLEKHVKYRPKILGARQLYTVKPSVKPYILTAV